MLTVTRMIGVALVGVYIALSAQYAGAVRRKRVETEADRKYEESVIFSN